MPYRILGCGSRNWDDSNRVYDAVWQYRMEYPNSGIVIVHGGAKGADTIIQAACDEYAVVTEVYKPDWDKHGKAAGFIRNVKMLDTGIDEVIAFWDMESPGTKHTITEARKRGIPVTIFA